MRIVSILRTAAAAVALLLGAGTAFAGECPADQVGIDVTKPGATANAGATDNVLAAIDLGEQATMLPDHMFRLRKLEIQPGGEVAWHSHGERPAIIYIVSGEMTEYRSTCAVPIVHKAGDVAPETKGTSHWWRNTGQETAVLLSADILHMKADDHMM
jgi:quercetin dioxygenase-like cupin family protein